MVYALILILPNTKWRDRLPAKPSFYRYIFVLFILNVLAGLGTLQPSCTAMNVHLVFKDSFQCLFETSHTCWSPVCFYWHLVCVCNELNLDSEPCLCRVNLVGIWCGGWILCIWSCNLPLLCHLPSGAQLLLLAYFLANSCILIIIDIGAL